MTFVRALCTSGARSIVPLRELRNSHAGVFRLAFLDKVGYPVVIGGAQHRKQNCCGSVEAEQAVPRCSRNRNLLEEGPPANDGGYVSRPQPSHGVSTPNSFRRSLRKLPTNLRSLRTWLLRSLRTCRSLHSHGRPQVLCPGRAEIRFPCRKHKTSPS